MRIGAFIRIHENFAGLVPIHELAERDGDEPESVLQIGDEVMVEVVGIKLYRRRILLSLGL